MVCSISIYYYCSKIRLEFRLSAIELNLSGSLMYSGKLSTTLAVAAMSHIVKCEYKLLSN